MRTLTCASCGSTFETNRPRKITCSPICAAALQKKMDCLRNKAKSAADPEYYSRQNAKKAEKIRNNPKLAEALQKKERKRSLLRRATPEQREHENANARARYAEKSGLIAENRRDRWINDPSYRQKRLDQARSYYQARSEEINRVRRKWRQAMTPDQRERYLERMRKYWNAYAAKHRASLVSNPELHEQYRERMREYERQYRANKALSALLITGKSLLERTEHAKRDD